MSCKCNAGVQAWGMPNCAPIPERFVRAFFVTELRPLGTHGAPTEDPIYADFPLSPPWLGQPGVPHVVSSEAYFLWRDFYRLVTPLADVVESERPEGVREEVGVNSYFVRESARSLTFIFARQPVELGRFMRQLRCQRELGVFLLDAAGVLWGRRAGEYVDSADENGYSNAERIVPIPVAAASIEPLMEFASPSTVAKWRLTLQLRQDFLDEELVPVLDNRQLLLYQPPMALEYRFVGSVLPSNIEIAIFARIATGPRQENLIPLTQAPTPAPRGYDAAGGDLGATTWNALNVAEGTWSIVAPAGTRYIKFSNTQLAGTITPAGFDWYGFRIDLP